MSLVAPGKLVPGNFELVIDDIAVKVLGGIVVERGTPGVTGLNLEGGRAASGEALSGRGAAGALGAAGTTGAGGTGETGGALGITGTGVGVLGKVGFGSGASGMAVNLD